MERARPPALWKVLVCNARGGPAMSQCHQVRIWGDIRQSLRHGAFWAMCWQNIVFKERVDRSREKERGRASREGGRGADPRGKV